MLGFLPFVSRLARRSACFVYAGRFCWYFGSLVPGQSGMQREEIARTAGPPAPANRPTGRKHPHEQPEHGPSGYSVRRRPGTRPGRVRCSGGAGACWPTPLSAWRRRPPTGQNDAGTKPPTGGQAGDTRQAWGQLWGQLFKNFRILRGGCECCQGHHMACPGPPQLPPATLRPPLAHSRPTDRPAGASHRFWSHTGPPGKPECL
jgi:hypothetical protein